MGLHDRNLDEVVSQSLNALGFHARGMQSLI